MTLKRPWSCRKRPACDGPASRDQEAVRPLLDDLDCVSAVKEAMEFQEEEGGRRGGSCKF